MSGSPRGKYSHGPYNISEQQKLPILIIQRSISMGAAILIRLAPFTTILFVGLVYNLKQPNQSFILWIILAFALSIIVHCINKMLSKRTLIMDTDTIICRDQTLFDTNEWSEPTKNYDGILYHNVLYPSPSGKGAVSFFVLSFQHVKNEKTLDLFRQSKNKNVRKKLISTARLLKLPIYEKGHDQTTKIEFDDIDKSLVELITEQKYQIDDEKLDQPKKIHIERNKDIINISIERVLYHYLIILFLGSITAIPQVTVKGCGHVYIGATMLVGMGLIMGAVLLTSHKLTITSDKIQAKIITKWGKVLRTVSINKNDIQLIKVGYHNRRKNVIIATREQELEFANGMKMEELKWIRNYLIENLLHSYDANIQVNDESN